MENMDNIEKKTEQPDTTPAENVSPEVKAEPEVKVEDKPETEAVPAEQEVNTEEKPVENKAEDTDDDTASDASTKFTLTVKQVWTVIKGFFSAKVVDCIAEQYNTKLPIWGILLPLYALLQAISATVSFNSSGEFKNGLTTIAGAKTTFGSGEVFFIMFAINLTLAFAMSIGVRAFIKFHKGDGHFLSSANLVTASYLPVMFVLLFNIVTVGAISPFLDSMVNIADIASIMLLFAGISKALGGKKPLWSFFFMMIIASVVAVIVAMIFISPILFSRIAYSLIDTLK